MPPHLHPVPAPFSRIRRPGPDWLVWCGLLLLLVSLLGFAFHQRWLEEALLGGAAHRQELEVREAASAWERNLGALQEVLERLGARRPAPFSWETEIARAIDDFPDTFLQGLVLLDHNGNVLAGAPSGFLASSALPLHLLSAPLTPTPEPNLHRLDVAGEPLLLFSQPLLSANPASRLLAVASLRGLLGLCLPEGQSCFVMDEAGHFLTSDLPPLHGLAFQKTVNPADQPELFQNLSRMSRGQTGSCRLPGVALPGLSGPAEEELLMSFHPLRTEGRRWSLALLRQTPSGRVRNLGILLALGGSALLVPGLLRLQADGRLARCGQLVTTERAAGLERELELERRRFLDLFENAGDALFFIDPRSGTLLQANRQAEELLGYSAAEIGSLSLAVLFPGRQRPRYLRLVRRVLKEGYGEDPSLLFRRKDGRLFAGSVHARLGHAGGRDVVHGVVRDVSEQLQMERELRRKNRDLSLLNQLAQDLVARQGLQGRLQAVLERLAPAFEADGGGVLLVRDQGTRLELTAGLGLSGPVRRLLEGLKPGLGLVGLVAASGRPRTSTDLQKDSRVHLAGIREAGWRSFQAIPVTQEERTLGVLFLFSFQKRLLDREELTLLLTIGRQLGSALAGAELLEELRWQNRLTEAGNRELRQSRQQLRRNLEQLDQANRALGRLDGMKNQFLALASHELRTPLTYILSGADLLATALKGRLTTEEASILAALHRGGERLDTIVRDLLEVARIESRDLYLAREPFDLGELLAEIGREFSPVAAARQLHMELLHPATPLRLTGDRHHLKRGLERLLENAVKFTATGGRVTLGAEGRSAADIGREQRRLEAFSPSFFQRPLPKDLVEITIADTGMGIDPEEQLRVFDKFYEVGDIDSHFTSRSSFGGKGVGLGLTLVKGVVEAHGGMVWLESAGTGEQGGTTVHVLLPRVPPQEAGDDPGTLLSGPAGS